MEWNSDKIKELDTDLDTSLSDSYQNIDSKIEDLKISESEKTSESNNNSNSHNSLLDGLDTSDIDLSSPSFLDEFESSDSSDLEATESIYEQVTSSDFGSIDVDKVKDVDFSSSLDYYDSDEIKSLEELAEDFSFDESNSYLIEEAETQGYETEGYGDQFVHELGGPHTVTHDPEETLFEDIDASLGVSFGSSVSASGRDVYTQSSLLNFYDSVMAGEDVSVGSFDSPGALFGQFVENHDDEYADMVSEVLGAWVNWPTDKSTAPLWHIFSEANDNFKVPIELQEDGIDAEAFSEALHSFKDFTQERMEERFGDSVVLYRSIDRSGFEDMKTEAPETGSLVLDHRPVESWTIDPEFAEQWSGDVILRKEVDVGDVLASQVTHPSFIGREKEFLVESSGREKYSEDEILRPGEFDREENAQWALSQLGGLENDTGRVYGPEWMAIENTVDQMSLHEYGAITANKSAEFMHVAEYEDGSQAFITELSPTEYQDDSGADPVEAERAIAGEEFFENIGLEKYIPEHFVDMEEGYMAVEAVDGYEIDNAPEEVKESVDAEEYLKFAAATILSGNSDMDGRNTMIDDEGHIYGIDIDHAGGDFTEGGRHYRRGMNDLKHNADKLGLDISYTDIKEATEIVADQIDPFEATEGIQSSQVSEKDMYGFRRNIVNNITSFASGEFPGEFGVSNVESSLYDADEVARV